MSLDTMGPLEDAFLEVYMDKAFRKAKGLISRARAVGVSLDELAEWARENTETIDFKLSLRESNGKSTSRQIG